MVQLSSASLLQCLLISFGGETITVTSAFQTSGLVHHQSHNHVRVGVNSNNAMHRSPTNSFSKLNTALNMATEMSKDDLKVELAKYLEKRKELDADQSAKSEVGKVVGGTKGNKVLEYISGAPNKALVIEQAPDIFDYDELAKYGFSNLVTPIMDNGGRREMYNLMGMPVPAVPDRITRVKKVPKLVIDRNGETDEARYTGLKVTQILDDDELGRKLAEVQQKQKEGKEIKKKLVEEEYEMPFADKRNTGPRQTPDWTPEKLDEEGRKAGQAQAWARKARAGEFKGDPFEVLSIDGSLQAYSIVTTLFVAFAFGNSSPKLFSMLDISGASGILDVLQAPALAMVLASVGSSIVCAVALAPGKNRNSFVWGIKGFAGGPLAVLKLRELEALITRGEAEEIERAQES